MLEGGRENQVQVLFSKHSLSLVILKPVQRSIISAIVSQILVDEAT